MKFPFTSFPQRLGLFMKFFSSLHCVLFTKFGQFKKFEWSTQSMMSKTCSGMLQANILLDFGTKSEEWNYWSFTDNLTSLTEFRAFLDWVRDHRHPLVKLTSTFVFQVVLVKLQKSFLVELLVLNDAGFEIVAVQEATATGLVLNSWTSFLAFFLMRRENVSHRIVTAVARLCQAFEKFWAIFLVIWKLEKIQLITLEIHFGLKPTFVLTKTKRTKEQSQIFAISIRSETLNEILWTIKNWRLER